MQTHTRKARRLLLLSTTCIIILGLLFMYSASSIYALELHRSSLYFLKRQLIGLGLGLIALIIIATQDERRIRAAVVPFFLVCLGLTIATIIPGLARPINGSRRWLHILGWSLQPSELLKPACVLMLAALLDRFGARIKFHPRTYLLMLMCIAIPSLIMLKQPDFGQAATWALTASCMLLCANIPLRYLFYTLIPALASALILIIAAPYRLRRLTTFLNPWADPLGSGFQIIQSLIAIGSGGILGTGLGASHQKLFYLPMQHTDFIFAIIAEEAGLIGSLTLLFLYALQFISGINLSKQAHSSFSYLSCIGISCMLALQACINIAVATGMVPTKGIGLPFVSYGNAALIANLLCIGLLLALSKKSS